jgi:hypothetical protein
MNKEFLEVLNEILAKEITAVTKSEIIFLRARRDYLTPEQLEKYKDLIEVKKEIKTKK